MKTGLCALVVAVALGAGAVWAQLSPPNSSGVAMGHLHYTVRDVEANREFWVKLGGEPLSLGMTEVVRFPDVLVFLSEGASSGGTEGSVVNHVAFRVRSLAQIEAVGLELEPFEGLPGIASVFTPGGERIELFDNSAVNLAFTLDAGPPDPTAERHNRPIELPIIAHHIHLFVPEDSVLEARDWYARVFGATPGTRWQYPAVDLPGINLNFSSSAEALAPIRGRMLDHIGFEVTNLEAFTQKLEAEGVQFDVPYSRRPSGIGVAFLTDPWGTYIELTEGLAGL